jgi:hypothetical protein
MPLALPHPRREGPVPLSQTIKSALAAQFSVSVRKKTVRSSCYARRATPAREGPAGIVPLMVTDIARPRNSNGGELQRTFAHIRTSLNPIPRHPRPSNVHQIPTGRLVQGRPDRKEFACTVDNVTTGVTTVLQNVDNSRSFIACTESLRDSNPHEDLLLPGF